MIKILSRLFGVRAAADPPYSYARWMELEIQAIRQCRSTAKLIQLLSHQNGYMREAALTRAVELASPALLPAIAARLNDWVPEVRRVAKAAMITLAPLVPTEDLIAQLPAVHQLRSASREDHAQWVGQFEEALIATVGTARIIDGMDSADIKVARACFRLVRTRALMATTELIKRALPASGDICVASEAFEMIPTLPSHERHELQLAALGSRFGIIRTAALRELLFSPTEAGVDLARTMLLDPQSSVRFAAIAYLEQRGIITAETYVSKLRDPNTRMDEIRISLLALAASGQREHLAFIKEHATSNLPRVQAAALASWLRVEPEAKDEITFQALQSKSAKVRKLSLSFIRNLRAYVPVETAIALALAQRDYQLMLRLARLDPWIWLQTIAAVQQATGRNSRFHPVLVHNLLQWLKSATNIYLQPGHEQRNLLGAPTTLSSLRSLLAAHESWRARLDYILEQFQIITVIR